MAAIASRQPPHRAEFFNAYRKLILPLILLIIGLTVWQWVAETGLVSKLVLASPTDIARAMVTESSTLAENAGITLTQSLLGFLIGNSVGLLLAIAFVHSELTRRVVYPLAIAAEAIPVVAVVPVLVLWLGNGMAPKIFIAAFLSFFPMLVNAFRGLRSADKDVAELMHTLAATRAQQLVLIRLPASIPFLFNALKFSACGSVAASLVAEWVASDRGLGFLIINYGQNYQIAEIWATALVASLASMGVYGIVVFAEYRLSPWLHIRKADL